MAVGAYLHAVWNVRYFWLSLVLMDLQTRYRRSVLGLGWSLVQPAILTIILYTVFSPVFLNQVDDYALYVLAGLVYWNYFTSTILLGCQCFLHAEGYIRQQPLPLAIFPLRAALGNLVHFLLALAVVLVATGCVRGFDQPFALLSLVPSILLMFGLAWTTALLAGFANVLFRDTEHLLQVGFQVLFYLTPIFYPAQLLSHYRLGWLVQLNPVTAFLQLLRQPLLENTVPSLQTYGLATAVVVGLGGLSCLVLHRLQRQLIFYL